VKIPKDINMYNSILRGLIRNSGLTQNEFSEKVNLSKCVISRLINCKTKGNPVQKQVIADYFNKPIEYIFKENNHGRHGKRKDRSDHTQNPTVR